MKRRVTFLVLLLVLFTCLVAWGNWANTFSESPAHYIIGAALAIAFAVVMIAWVTAGDTRSSSLLRVDWFLPELRRVKKGEQPNRRRLGDAIRSWAPKSWTSNHQTKQRGRLRKQLRGLGNSWLASPVRRVVQGLCLALFLLSFFYVCWPYRARPASAPLSSDGLRFVDFDQETGGLRFRSSDADAAPSRWGSPDQVVFLTGGGLEQSVGVRVTDMDEDVVELAAPDPMPDSLFDALLATSGDWSLLDRDPDAWPSHYADTFADGERIPADLFLAIDPLVSLSTAIASRSWVWSLVCAAIILMVCLLIPRGFCGYLCPLGTTIDLFDWAIGSRTTRFQVADDGWWVHIKYYLLAGTLIAAALGILVSGVVSAIPVITRAMLFFGEPLQSGFARGWHLVPAPNAGQYVSMALFLGVLFLGFLRPRFWCKYVCPSGALFSLGNLFRITERKVEASCINCNKCVEICPFDAIKADYTTRGTDCTMCQSCGGVCPTHAIKFVERWNVVELKVENDPPTHETPLGRRGFMSLAGGTAAAVIGGVATATAVKSFGAGLGSSLPILPVRPPGSVPEQQFLEMCIRCGECFKVCPNNVLQPIGFEQGLEGIWTPKVEADWAGCESSCNACGQVCPTGAIRALPMEEKRVARMGLAIVNESTCLPMAGKEDCDLCVQECNAAGYNAIEYIQVGTEMDEFGMPLEGTGMLAPVVLADDCVGCGLCQTRCFAINVKERHVLQESAIVIETGKGREDRLMAGSYREARDARANRDVRANRDAAARPAIQVDSKPEFQLPSASESTGPVDVEINADSDADSDNPFGL